VELRAPDTVGFLERVLRLFAVHALYAHEMRVDTHGAEVHDVFRLRNLSGLPPGGRAIASLERSLARLVR
jgi:UTP:GlnB (protein PII) uridylyltransferase